MQVHRIVNRANWVGGREIRAPRLAASLVAALLAVIAGLVFSNAWAQAATAPTVESESVTDVASTSATLQAQLDPGGAETTYRFEYVAGEGGYTTSVPIPDASAGAGEAGQPVSVHVQGLATATAYHYRVVASNELQTVDGPDQTFTTQSPGGGAVLPDGRQYELVSPPNKEGAEVALSGLGGEGLIAAVAADGSKVAYLGSQPFANPQSYSNDVQILAVRGPSGWASTDISPHHNATTGLALDLGPEFQVFSSDLSHAVVQPFGPTALSPLATEGYELAYLSDALEETFQPLLTTKPEGVSPGEFQMHFVDGTPDLSHIVIRSPDALTPTPAPTGQSRLYEWSDGRLQLVNFDPEGVPTPEAKIVGMSEDGTRILWSYQSTLYVRDMTAGKTIEVGNTNETLAPEAAISADGSRVFFIGVGVLPLGGEEKRLHVLNLDSSPPTLAVVDSDEEEQKDEVLAISADDSYVYYQQSRGPGQGVYVAHLDGSTWTHTLIEAADVARGPLEGRSEIPTYNGGRTNGGPPRLALATSDGRYFAFTSAADGQTYIYNALARRMICLSCNPTGMQSVAPSALSFLADTGRVLFQTSEALLARDTNGLQNVYEWEPEGVGSCQSSPGCLALISSGTGDGESTFLGASTSGDDVFFRARDRLTLQDDDNNYDVYDAHVCSPAVPCTPSLASPPPCTSSDACKAPSTPQPGLFGPPASATFVGAGNVASSLPSAAVKPQVKKKKPRKHRKVKSGKRKAKKAMSSKSLPGRAKR